MRKPKVGLLGLYLELYDRVAAEVRPQIDSFYETIASQLENRGLEVARASVCRLQGEFQAAVASFEEAQADAIITLHLAYSPSLESAQTLARTDIPVIVLDTTPSYSYGPQQDPAQLMFNHGIHGVQDMCNVLRREGKPFQIEAGHWEKCDVLDRVVNWARAAKTAASMRKARIGRIGEQFKGMGDFAVDPGVLRSTIGVETVPAEFAVLKSLMPAEDDAEDDVEAASEMKSDLERFEVVEIDEQAHLGTTRACLAVRRWIEQENLTGFTMNFDAIDASSGLPTVPFLEASKAMTRGLGYAGEGDVLTAAFVGALASSYPETTFTEMFCPDWENDGIFLSHMGEMNLDLCEGKPTLMKKSLPWVNTGDPVLAVGRFRAGKAAFVDLAPGPDDTYELIIAPVQVVGAKGRDTMEDTVRGWIRPELPLPDFLEDYSRLGGTHHAALVYGNVTEDLLRFAQIMGWNAAVLG